MGKVGGLLLIFLVIGIVGYLMYSGDQRITEEAVKEKIISTSRDFVDGSVIEFYSPPSFTDDEISKFNVERAFNSFYEDNTIDDVIDFLIKDRAKLHGDISNFLISHGVSDTESISFINSLEKNELSQHQILSAKANLTPAEKNELQVLLNKDTSKIDELENVIAYGITGANVTSIHYEGLKQIASEDIKDGIHVVYRGEIAKIVGKIVKSTGAPYFYNVDIRCCNDQEVLQKSHIGTDADGTFLYEFPTSLKTPLGVYRVTIITTNVDSSSLIEYFYDFQLIK